MRAAYRRRGPKGGVHGRSHGVAAGVAPARVAAKSLVMGLLLVRLAAWTIVTPALPQHQGPFRTEQLTTA